MGDIKKILWKSWNTNLFIIDYQWIGVGSSYPILPPGRSVFKRFPSFEPYVAQWLISDQIFFSPVLKKRPRLFFLLQFFVAFFKLCSQAWCHMSLCDRYHARKQSLPNSFCAPCNCTKCTWRKQWKGNWTGSRYRKFSNCAQNNVIEIILFSYWARPTVHELSGIDRWYTALVVSGTPTMIYHQVPALAMKAACARFGQQLEKVYFRPVGRNTRYLYFSTSGSRAVGTDTMMVYSPKLKVLLPTHGKQQLQTKTAVYWFGTHINH